VTTLCYAIALRSDNVTLAHT